MNPGRAPQRGDKDRAGCARTRGARSWRSIMAAAPGAQAGHQHRLARRLRQNFTAASLRSLSRPRTSSPAALRVDTPAAHGGPGSAIRNDPTE